MSWDEQLFALFDDLESQAEVMYGVERELEVLDRARIEYQGVTLASRLMATVGADVRLDVVGVGPISGRLLRVATGWCVLRVGGADWVVAFEAIGLVVGGSTRSVPEVAWPLPTKLTLGSACRRLAETRETCLVHLRDASRHEVVFTRVGADFVEGTSPSGQQVLVPFASLAAIRSPDSD